MYNFRPLFSLNFLKIHHKLPRKMDRSYDSLKGQKVTPAPHPWRGLQGGSAPCV